MNQNRLNYERQSNVMRNLDVPKNVVPKVAENKMTEVNKTLGDSNNRIGRNQARQVRMENSNYNVNNSGNVDTSFTHSNIDFAKKILEKDDFQVNNTNSNLELTESGNKKKIFIIITVLLIIIILMLLIKK